MLPLLFALSIIVAAILALASLYLGWRTRGSLNPLTIDLSNVHLVGYISEKVEPYAGLPVSYDGHEITLKVPELEDETHDALYVLSITDDAADQLVSTRDEKEAPLFRMSLPHRHHLLGLGAEYDDTDGLLHLVFYCATPFSFLTRRTVQHALNLDISDVVEVQTNSGRKVSFVSDGKVIRLGGT